jgi:8-oxo-dGTP pyrophosphatase MutT (NUDIX family)
MTSSAAARARLYGYRAFYHLPLRWRRAAVRMVSTKYSVGAVVLVFDRDAARDGVRRMLLLHQPPGRGWSLPGGVLNRHEDPADGAARELSEETGIRLDPAALAPAAPNAVVHPHGRWVDMVFEAHIDPATEVTVDGGEVFEAAWYRLDELPRLTTATAALLGRYGIGPRAAGEPEVAA